MKKSKLIYKRYIELLLLAMLIMLTGCSTNNSKGVIGGDIQSSTNSKLHSQSNDNSANDISSEVTVNGKLKVHYINVGQGDSILIQQGIQNMLIDAGTNDSTETLMNYLKSQNIKKLDYLILTHPHEDHIGGADAVIKSLDI